jgi:hypothetical protein
MWTGRHILPDNYICLAVFHSTQGALDLHGLTEVAWPARQPWSKFFVCFVSVYEGGVTVFSLKLWRPLAESRVRVPKTCHVSSSFFKVKKSVSEKLLQVLGFFFMNLLRFYVYKCNLSLNLNARKTWIQFLFFCLLTCHVSMSTSDLCETSWKKKMTQG